jgi:signal transduction histidine kinase
VVETDALVQQLRAARARQVTAADAERRTIERALHDGVQQDLIAIAVRLQLARRLADSDLPAALTLLDEMGTDVRDALDRVRTLADGIYPSLLEVRGLPDALRSAASAIGVNARVDADGVGRHPAEIEAAAFFCCRAVLEDLAANGEPDARATIRIRKEPGVLRVEIAAGGTSAFGEGLTSARDRVDALGGELAVESGPGRDARIVVTLPL